MAKKFYITTPLYYVNAPPHIGHSYTNIACDCLARFKRQQGYEVFFLTGTDEHGQKVKLAAEAEGLAPQVFTDKVAPKFKTLWGKLNISYDDFIRTSESRHIKAVDKVLRVLHKQGDQPCFGRINSASRALDSERHPSTLAFCQSPWRGKSGRGGRWFSDRAPPLPYGPQRRVVSGECVGVWSQTQVAV